ncbi:MAG: hypothetical protein ACOYN6_00655 [Ignavibacteria bacterium]
MKFKQLILKYFYVISSLFLFVFASCGPSSDFRDMHKEMSESGQNRFFADPLVFYDSASSKPRLDLSVEIPIANISFQKNYQNNTYYSKIFITVNLKNAAGETVQSKKYEETSLYSYEEIKAKAKESQLYLYSYSVTSDVYKLEVELKDVYMNSDYKKSFSVNAVDFASLDMSTSDLMLLSKIDVNPDGTKEITPHINNNIFGIKEMSVFFEIYNNSGGDVTKDYSLKLMSDDGEVIKETALHYNLTPGKNQKFENVFSGMDIMKHLESEPTPDVSQPGPVKKYSFKIEMFDVSTGKVIALKKLLFYPDRLRPGTLNRPPPR